MANKIILMSNPKKYEPDSGGIAELDPEINSEVRQPKMFQVLILNDDYTPMDFVIHVLMKFFSHSEGRATEIMWDVHKKGAGICGTYTKEIAETKSFQVNKYSELHEHPLKSTIQEVS